MLSSVCSVSRQIQFIGGDGNFFSASLITSYTASFSMSPDHTGNSDLASVDIGLNKHYVNLQLYIRISSSHGCGYLMLTAE